MTTPRTLSLAALLSLSSCYAGPSADLAATTPRSLAGTAVDGELRTDPDGGFVFDERARLTFDYFLTADAELAPAELTAWVRAELDRRLPASAADEAFAAWAAYLEFRGAAAATLAQPLADPAAAERDLLAALDARLGDYPIVAAERAQISRAFALRRIDALAGEARERALAEFAAADPQSSHDDTGSFAAARREIAAAQLAGADDLHALRREHFGAAAADRLAALDVRRAAWTQRVEALRAARTALSDAFTGTPAQLDAALAGLESQHFSAAELRRVHALDRLAMSR